MVESATADLNLEQELAEDIENGHVFEIRNQLDRNIRKMRNTYLRKMQVKLYEHVCTKDPQQLYLRDREFRSFMLLRSVFTERMPPGEKRKTNTPCIKALKKHLNDFIYMTGGLNMSEATYGTVSINKNNYPFTYDDNSEKITIHFGGALEEITGKTDEILGKKINTACNGLTFFKLSSPIPQLNGYLHGDAYRNYATENTQVNVEYSVDNYHPDAKYTEMRLQFPELDYFVSSKFIAQSSDENVSFPRKTNTVRQFNVICNGICISVSFRCGATINIGAKAHADTFSEVRLSFPETESYDFLEELYMSVRSFFAFICNRQNIGLRNAKLIGSWPDKYISDGENTNRISTINSQIYFSCKYIDAQEEDRISKTPYLSLFEPNVRQLFQLFFNKNANEPALVYGTSIHSSYKRRNLIDLEHSLQITSTFEYYVRTKLPEISSSETLEFYDDVQGLINQYAESLNRKKRKKAKEFLNCLHPRVSLSDKIKKVYDGYDTWAPLKPILEFRFKNGILELAKAANAWRNELAHEKRQYQPDANVIPAIRLVEHINYCIVLRVAGYSDEEIQKIIEYILK